MPKLELAMFIIAVLLSGCIGVVIGLLVGANKQKEPDLCSLTKKELDILIGLFPQYLKRCEKEKNIRRTNEK